MCTFVFSSSLLTSNNDSDDDSDDHCSASHSSLVALVVAPGSAAGCWCCSGLVSSTAGAHCPPLPGSHWAEATSGTGHWPLEPPHSWPDTSHCLAPHPLSLRPRLGRVASVNTLWISQNSDGDKQIRKSYPDRTLMRRLTLFLDLSNKGLVYIHMRILIDFCSIYSIIIMTLFNHQ